MDRSVVLLHRYPDFLQQCCQLINSEWKRSETARMRTLQISSDKPPTCLILVTQNRVIGHCKLTPIPNMSTHACYIESVVIDKACRGKGHGSYLMLKAEEYCKFVLTLQRVYLSTKGQEEFYSKLGYRECGPISIYGSIGQRIDSISQKSGNSENRLTVLDNAPSPPPMPQFNNNLTKKTYMYKDL